MDTISCQYCNADVSMVEVEKESGICPECGSMISGASLFDQADENDDIDVYDEDDDLDLDDLDALDDEDDTY